MHQQPSFVRRLVTLAAAIVLIGNLSTVVPATAMSGGPYAGLTLEHALRRLADAGLPLIFTDRVVEPRMRVEHEPTADDPRAILDQMLRPHGLAARPGAGGVLMVVVAGPTAAIEGVIRMS